MAANKPDNKRISGLVSGIRSTMDKLYTGTYYANPKVSKDLETLSNSINKNLDRITSSNTDTVGTPMVSKLYGRMNIFDTQKDSDVINAIQNVFSDNAMMDSVMSAYMENKHLRDYDEEIDVVCKYMPKLREALDVRKDNVLSADHFSKDFTSVVNLSSRDNEIKFSERINKLKKTYEFNKFIERVYDNVALYGEEFIYHVPYKKALKKLIDQKPGTNLTSVRFSEHGAIVESASTGKEILPDFSAIESGIGKDSININIEFNESNMIDSVIKSYSVARSKKQQISESSVMGFNEANLNKTVPDDLVYDKDDSIGTSDGFIDINKKDNGSIANNFPGSIIKVIPRDQVIPIYIEDMCLGYYYIEVTNGDSLANYMEGISDPMLNLKSMSSLNKQDNRLKKDYMLKYLSGHLSKMIDTKFINHNQDLRKELYMILKHNDTFNAATAESIKITFIPPEDMFHVTFRKDPKTHRGISDLERALVPAKLYASLYVTNTIAVMTRGQDKRVYYVKQTVDTNISKTLMNTINQIKKSNFGIRQIENINNVLNITGRFNDYIIPTGPDGAPVQFEVLQGQNIDVKTDLMNILEEAAINSTDVPLEIIQARQSADYAIGFTMSNSKFLRKVYNRQGDFQDNFLSPFVTRLYNSEYNENDELELRLAPPMFLNITNVNQVINNTKDYVNSLLEDELADEEDDLFKAVYKKDLLDYHLGSYINKNIHQEIKDRARLKAAIKRKESIEAQPEE